VRFPSSFSLRKSYAQDQTTLSLTVTFILAVKQWRETSNQKRDKECPIDPPASGGLVAQSSSPLPVHLNLSYILPMKVADKKKFISDLEDTYGPLKPGTNWC